MERLLSRRLADLVGPGMDNNRFGVEVIEISKDA
jgi:hypothetical protein